MKSVRLRIPVSIMLLLLLIFQAAPVFAEIKSEPYVSIDNPKGIIWTGKVFIVAAEEDDVIKLFSVTPKDKKIERFGPTFAGKDEVHIASSSGAYFPPEYIYASSGDTIYEITSKGDTVRNFAVPSKGVNIAGLAFDNRGYWNYKLLAVTYDGSVWEVEKSGAVERIATLGGDVAPGGIVVARDEYGDFSGHALISVNNKIVAISHKDHSVRTLTELSGETPRQLLYIYPNSDIYIAEQDKDMIVRVDREIVQNYLAQVMVITESTVDKSMVAVKSARAGVEVEKIASGVERGAVGFAFVLDNEFNEALKEVEQAGIEINPLLIIFPILLAVLVATFLVIWRYRGF